MTPAKFNKLAIALMNMLGTNNICFEANTYADESLMLHSINGGVITDVSDMGTTTMICEENNGVLFFWTPSDFDEAFLDILFENMYAYTCSEEQYGDCDEFIQFHG